MEYVTTVLYDLWDHARSLGTVIWFAALIPRVNTALSFRHSLKGHGAAEKADTGESIRLIRQMADLAMSPQISSE